jgi:hypothetical protein
MKTSFLIFLYFVGAIACQAQVCPPNGVSTNPLSPNNPADLIAHLKHANMSCGSAFEFINKTVRVGIS